ncbi:MAG TPA: hypothetical protein VF849_00810 [Blattabacteriaceae bacterium]
MGKNVQLVGDDLFVTNLSRLKEGRVIIIRTIMSHRSVNIIRYMIYR